ncbi:MAG: hypothetical protein H0V73_09165 [Chloroflexi bacterium]|nr:hypothetical protein [Chloroflexota bacterium]
MTDHRRAVRLCALLAAGLAVAGTSASPVPPAPTQPLSVNGTVHLTAADPVAIQPLSFVVGQGNLTSLAVTPAIGDAPAQGSVVASIVSTDPTEILLTNPATGSASGAPLSSWAVDCRAGPCERRYALVMTWLDAPDAGASDVAWTVDATATFVGSVPAGATPGVVT